MKKLLIFCLAVGFVFMFGNIAMAADLNVPDPYPTIQDAINVADPGDIIIVADGTYTITGRILVDRGVTITGNVTNPENVLVKYNPASSTLNCVEVNSADVTIQGIKVQDCKNGFHFDRNVNTNTGVTISNCIVESVSGWGIGEISSPNTVISHNTITNAGDKGIYFRKCEGTSESNRCEAISNVISGCVWPAIQTYFSKYAYIYDNTISSTNDKGINIIKSGATGTADRIQVIGNTISETKWPGIQVIGSPHTYVYSNTLTKCNYHGSDGTGDWDYASIHVEDDGAVSGANVIIDSNTVSDGINGIQTWSDDCEITCNSIYDMGLTYANTKTTTDGTYYNSGIIIGSNWLTSNLKPTATTVTCNNIYDNYWGLYVRNYATMSPDDPSMLSVIAKCNWWGDLSGPGGVGPGTGDAVSYGVDYDPWITAANYTGGTLFQVTENVLLQATYKNSDGETPSSVDFYFDVEPVVNVNTHLLGVFTLDIGQRAVGVYSVKSEAVDWCQEDEALVVVYDPSAGFVTGGGWINSPAGAYVGNPSLTGKANFGFVAKYDKKTKSAQGNTEFVFEAGPLDFHSNDYDWLIVNKQDLRAQFKGHGTINDTGDYNFMLWATDGDPSSSEDTFRIKIWDEDDYGNETVIYDNGFDGSGYETGQPIDGGNILVHTAKDKK